MTGTTIVSRAIGRAACSFLLLGIAGTGSAAPPARALMHQSSYGSSLEARLLGVDGRWEHVDGVSHLIAHRLLDMSALLGALDSRSRDFH